MTRRRHLLSGGPPVVLRPATADDLADIVTLLRSHRHELTGMTSLSTDPALVEARLEDSVATVAALAAGRGVLEPGTAHHVLFVLVDRGRVVGLTGVAVDGGTPSVQLRVTLDDAGENLVARCDVTTDPRTELESTFLGRTARGRGLGTLLSRGRFLWLHLVADRVPTTLVSYLRGCITDDGIPFWESFARHLGDPPPPPPTDRSVLIGAAVPLDPELAERLGRLHPASRPAFELLVGEGLHPDGRFDPIDGGPTLSGRLHDTATARHLRWGRVGAAPATPTGGPAARESLDVLAAVPDIAAFAATDVTAVVAGPDRVPVPETTTAVVGETRLVVPHDTLAALGLDEGDLIAWSPRRPAPDDTGPVPGPRLDTHRSPQPEATR